MYPDPEDRAPAVIIERGSSAAGWDRADRDLVSRAAAHCPERGLRSGLDVGAGTGRLFPAIAACVDAFVAIEPDSVRHALASREADLHPTCEGVVAADILHYSTERRYDLVVCAHVIQHVARQQRAVVVSTLRRLTAPAGVVLMTYSCTARSDEQYFVTDGVASDLEPTTSLVTATEFDAAFDRPGVLPVWHSASGNVDSLLEGQGFSVIDGGVYRGFHHLVTTSNGSSPLRGFDAFSIGRAC